MLLQLITVIFLLSSLFASHVNAGTTPRNAPSLAHTLSDTHDNAPLLMYQQALNYLLGRNGAEKSAKKAAELFKTLAEQNWSSAKKTTCSLTNGSALLPETICNLQRQYKASANYFIKSFRATSLTSHSAGWNQALPNGAPLMQRLNYKLAPHQHKPSAA